MQPDAPVGRAPKRTWARFIATVLLLLPGLVPAWAAQLDSREFKMLLETERFSDRLAGAQTFWGLVVGVAETVDVPTSGEMVEEKARQVSFLDTKKHRLRRDYGYVFRERVKLDADGDRDDKKSITLKYRADELEEAAKKDLTPTIGKEDHRETKLEEDVVPEMRSKFSNSGTTKVDTDREFKRVRDVAEGFPTLGELPKKRLKKKLREVNDFSAHEIKVEQGVLALVGDVEAEASFSFWYEKRADGRLLVAEFSYGYEVDQEAPSGEAEEKARRLFRELQRELSEWMDPQARTKTQIAYEAGR